MAAVVQWLLVGYMALVVVLWIGGACYRAWIETGRDRR